VTPALRIRIADWLSRSHGTDVEPVELSQRRIYILPTPAGLLLALTLVLMLLGCINYNLSLGYILTFLLTGVGLVSMLHTFRNLARLRVRAGRAEPVFAGETARFPVLLENPSRLSRYAVAVELREPPVSAGETESAPSTAWSDIPADSIGQTEIRIPTQRRGRLRLPRIQIETTFPLGLFRAWSSVALDSSCLVYPRPEVASVPLPPPQMGDDEGIRSGRGQDDFAGLRTYHRGDSLRHVAWKVAARGQPLLTKQFAGPATGALWLSWSELPRELGIEARVSRLTRWVLEATNAGLTFGLELPDQVLAPASGHAHQERCLAGLALLKPYAVRHEAH
jgi:uncharacterized protein (DUF58 family)